MGDISKLKNAPVEELSTHSPFKRYVQLRTRCSHETVVCKDTLLALFIHTFQQVSLRVSYTVLMRVNL